MKKSCGELINEIVGPAGSTSVGAFSCRGWDEEPCWLLDDWAEAGWIQAEARKKNAAESAPTTLQ